jgi:hypothetical protein
MFLGEIVLLVPCNDELTRAFKVMAPTVPPPLYFAVFIAQVSYTIFRKIATVFIFCQKRHTELVKVRIVSDFRAVSTESKD